MGRVKIFGVELITTEDGAGWLAQSRGSELVPPLLEAIGIAALPVSRDGYLGLRPELRLQVLLEVAANGFECVGTAC